MAGYDALFQQYGRPSSEGRVYLQGYFVRPEKLTQERIAAHDKTAARLIEECEQTAAALREYRKALAARYANLDTAPYRLRLILQRWHQDKGVRFTVEILQIYEDGTEVQKLREVYTGKDRRKALARFEELRKQHPGIEVEKDIERKSWEH